MKIMLMLMYFAFPMIFYKMKTSDKNVMINLVLYGSSSLLLFRTIIHQISVPIILVMTFIYMFILIYKFKSQSY